MDWVDAARVGIAVAVLGAAAYTDLKTRMAPDGLWYGGAAAAVVLMALDFASSFGGVSWVLAPAVGAIFVVGITGGEIISVFPGDQVPPPPEQWRAITRPRRRSNPQLGPSRDGRREVHDPRDPSGS